jgi:small subunit ribosomal protein S7e
MADARRRIWAKNLEPSELDIKIAQALIDIESTAPDLKTDMGDLQIASTKEIETTGDKNALVIFIPYIFHKKAQRSQSRLIRELEKKFSKYHVIFITQRTILPTNYVRYQKRGNSFRPRSRTLTAVHNAILKDIAFPAGITGKRIRYRLDGSKLLKVILDPKEAKDTVDYKINTLAAVYSKLTNKSVQFQIPIVNEAETSA